MAAELYLDSLPAKQRAKEFKAVGKAVKNKEDAIQNGGWMRGPYTVSRATDYSFDVLVKIVGDKFYSPLFGNVTCAVYNSTSYVCEKRDHWFAILTLFFIYLPSINVIASLYGPFTAGGVGMLMSLGMAVLGGVFAVIGYFVSSTASSITG